MIDDSIYAETHRLAGLGVIDSRGITDVKDGYAAGDVWLRRSRDLLALDGWSVRFDDKPELIPATEPLNEVALYLGWYNADALGPWVTPPDRFARGAIAYHLHSYSATTVRSETSAWVGPLIAHGAAATMGTVYEPYLDLTPHLDIFTKRLLDGDSFAEAAYASEKGLSWMTTVVGDPLYRPFRQPLAAALAAEDAHPSDHHDWLLLQHVQRALAQGDLQPSVPALAQALNLPSARGFAQEGLGDLLDKMKDPAASAAAEEAYRRALTLDTLPIDRIRIGLKLAQHYIDRNQAELAQNELKGLVELYPRDAARFGIASPLVPTGAMPPPPRVPAPPSPPKP
jgi:tetratricopeptide (TPR) repeat protein